MTAPRHEAQASQLLSRLESHWEHRYSREEVHHRIRMALREIEKALSRNARDTRLISSVLARIDAADLLRLFEGYGYHPLVVESEDPIAVHQQLAATFDAALAEIREIQQRARRRGNLRLPRWPMIILRTPKGWTGPKEVDGLRVEGYWRSHQVPIPDVTRPEHLEILEDWMKGYRPETLFDESGWLKPEIAELAPAGDRRMGANPHANGGLLLKPLHLPDYRDYALDVKRPGATPGEATRHLGTYLRDVMKLNLKAANFCVMGEEGTTTPFDMAVRNDLDRFHLVMDVANRVPALKHRAGHIHQAMHDRLVEHWEYITRHGEDMPAIRDWVWPGTKGTSA